MAEYIEREAALEIAMRYCPDDDGYCSNAGNDLREMLDEIEAIPAADVRPVVNCGECKHWFRIKKDCVLASCELDALVRSEDFFCAAGEREVEHD